jgi:hypothetical protein
LKVTETLTSNTLDLRLTEGSDTVQFTGDLAGRVTVQREGQQKSLAVRTATESDQTAVLNLLAGSTALRSFDALMDTAWGRSAKPAAPFRSARALLALFRGDYAPTAAVVASMTSPRVSVMPVRRDGPDACWSAYSHDVLKYTYDLEGCVAEARDSYFPLALGWCAYEYDLKTGLAFVWLLNCYSLL